MGSELPASLLEENPHAPQVVMLRVSQGRFVNYCYVIVNSSTGAAVVIDPAWDIEAVRGALRRYDADLRGILLTHHHFDHTHLAGPLSLQYGARIFVSRDEAEAYDLRYPMMETFGSDTELDLEGISIGTLLTPGHTRGSTCYLAGNACFTGDTLFNEGCGLCHGPGADPYALYHSVQKLKSALKADTRIYPGHRYYEALGQRFQSVFNKNLYLHFRDAESFVRFRMRENQKGLFNFI